MRPFMNLNREINMIKKNQTGIAEICIPDLLMMQKCKTKIQTSPNYMSLLFVNYRMCRIYMPYASKMVQQLRNYHHLFQ